MATIWCVAHNRNQYIKFRIWTGDLTFDLLVLTWDFLDKNSDFNPSLSLKDK